MPNRDPQPRPPLPTPGLSGESRVLVAVFFALVVLGPLGLLFVRALRTGDTVVLDRRLAQVKPGVMPNAVPGGDVVVRGLEPGVALPERAQTPTVQLRLSSTQRSRILLVWSIEPRGQARLVWPQDGEYFTLGPCPPAGATFRFRITSLSPQKGWGLAPAVPLSVNKLEVSAGVARAPIDYRVVATQPVSIGEWVARLTFFLRVSWVALVCFIAGVASLALAFIAIRNGRVPSATAGLVTALTLLYISLTPPFQAADETSHIGTMEYVAARETANVALYWPASITIAAHAIEQDRVQYNPEEALPLNGRTERDRVASALGRPWAEDARRSGVPPTEAFLQIIPQRSEAFYSLAGALHGRIAALSVLDRIYLFRVLAGGIGLLAALLGVLVLYGGRQPAASYLVLVTIVTIPEWAAIASSATNYAPGIGFALLAGCMVLTSLRPDLGPDLRWLAAACATAAAGGFFLRDDFLLATALAALLVLVVACDLAYAMVVRDRKRTMTALMWAASLAGIVIAAILLFPTVQPENVAAGLALFRSATLAPFGAFQAFVVLLPILISTMFVAVHRLAKPAARRTVAIAASAGVLVVLLVGSHFSDGRVPTSALVEGWTPALYSRRFLAALAGTFLSWDQDFFAWDTLWGALGWHDVIYPHWMYALTRWGATAVLLALPIAYHIAARRMPRLAFWSLFVSSWGTSLFLAALQLRTSYVMLHGRFLLFALPLIVLPMAGLMHGGLARRVGWAVVAFGLAADFYTLLYLIPVRYLLAGGGHVAALVP